MKTVKQLADLVGMTPAALNYYMLKPDAPEPEYKKQKGRMIRCYDEADFRNWWNNK